MRRLSLFALVLGCCTLAVVLSYHHNADGDLWSRLAVGKLVWNTGHVPRHDSFAFTPTLPEWIDHEWGAGLLFFTLLKAFGPAALMALKILLALLALGTALLADRCRGGSTPVLLVLAIPCALAVLPGYVPVIRSHALTFAFFGATLLCLEWLRAGKRWPAVLIVAVMLAWVNVHGGFVVGLGMIALYAILATEARRACLLTLLASLAVTLVNPYGIRFWSFLIPALLHPRPSITEWSPIPLWGDDPYVGFRVLCVIAVIVVAVGWRRGSSVSVVMLVLTAGFAWRSRRHAPFFGLAAAAYLGPYLQAVLERQRREIPSLAVLGLYGALAAFVAVRFLPHASLEPVTPASFYPVRAVDILAAAGIEGNLAVPFRWGAYASWRLYPRIKVSMDGRYEETYPDATYAMNRAFFLKDGKDWDRLLRQHQVDFIIIELRATGLSLDDLRQQSFALVWSDQTAALLARRDLAPALHLPKTSLDPFQ